MEEALPSIRRTGCYATLPATSDRDPSEVGEDLSTPDGLKLRKVNTVARIFGEHAACQLYVKLGLEWVPAMASALAQTDLLDGPAPHTVTVTFNPNGGAH